MYAFCQDVSCRHRALVAYFGQSYAPASCGACDVCLGETTPSADTAGIAAKILAAAAELRGRFGGQHLADVLCGARGDRIARLGHERLAAYGGLRGEKRSQVRGWIDQLTGQGLLARAGDEYPTVAITKEGAAVLRGERVAGPLSTSRLSTPPPPSTSRAQAEPGREEVSDASVFEALRILRRAIAEERGVPPYLVFSDASLRDMARVRPLTLADFRLIRGVGDWKLEAFGDRFVAAVRQACLASSSAQRA
jgi:ATP-dependent DNA helicase RecQ